MTVEQISHYINIASSAVVVFLWFAFAGVFLLRKRPASAPDKVGVPSSWVGLILQGLGFGIVWAIRRSPVFTPIVDEQFVLNIVLQILAILLAAASVWLAMSAIRELGKQWSLQARLLEGHKLVTTGVYRLVRHPIYTAMMGMLISTGLVFSHWIALATALVIFLIGTRIRTSIEERLLSDGFGKEYTDWKARVPGLIPFIKF
jgi:protein-S-isoprenylcysteine O-methyltransferase Ste14